MFENEQTNSNDNDTGVESVQTLQEKLEGLLKDAKRVEKNVTRYAEARDNAVTELATIKQNIAKTAAELAS